MFTRCQACHTVHPINAAVLAQGSGKYRCGKCHKISNALEALFDEWPQAKQQGTRPGNVPELGLSLAPPAEGELAAALDETPDDAEGRPRWKQHLPRALWLIAAVVLIGVIGWHLTRFFQQPQAEFSRLQSVLVQLGLKQAPMQAPLSSSDQFGLLSRELKTAPHRPGTLILTATMVNRAEHTQIYPRIEVTLFDIHNQPAARHLFEPADYLSYSKDLRNGMAPQAHLTFSLEMPDPGDGVVGFELQFQ